MQPAPLQLTDYFVHSIQVDAAPDYDSDKSTELDFDSLHVKQECVALDDSDYPEYSILMMIRQELVEGKNIPYSYQLQIVGRIAVMPGFPAEKIKRAVEINGPSMLFGAAREIIRAATGRGPYGPVLMPSTSFFKPAADKTTPAKGKATKAARRITRAKASVKKKAPKKAAKRSK